MFAFLPSIRSFGLNFPSADRWVVLLLALIFLSSLFWYYARTLPPLEKQQRRFLLGLRLAGLVCLFLVLAEPIAALFLVSREKPVVAVLMDRSGSMGKQNREKQAEEAVEKLTSQKGDWEYRLWDFGDTLAEFRSLSSAKPTATAIGSVLRYVAETPRLAGVVLASDGGSNSGPDPVKTAEKLGVPVYAIGVGQEEKTPDLGIEKIDYPPAAFEGTPIKVELTASARGIGRAKLPLTLSRGNKKIAAPIVDFSGDGEQSVTVELTPDSIGPLTYSAALPVLAKEEQTKNNRRIFSIRVLKAKLKVLLVSGQPGWNYRFLWEVLGDNPRVEVEGLVYGPGGQPLYNAAPLSSRKLEDCDVLIFCDFRPGLAAGAESRLLAAVRNQGKGVFFLLGPEFLREPPPAWAELLPFDFTKKPAVAAGPVGGLDLTPEGEAHPATRLSPDPTELGPIWKNLPPLEGVLTSDLPSSAGAVLATVPAAEEGGRYPALAAKNFGKGRVLASAVFPLWKWYFLPLGTSSEDTTFAWFVNQSTGWLSGSEEADRFNLTADKLVYQSGEEAAFTATAFDEGHKPYEGLDVKVRLKGEDLLLYEEAAGRYAGRKRILAPGSYEATAEFSRGGKKAGEAKCKIAVEELSLEDQSVSYNPTVLQKMASVSGGEFYRPEETFHFAADFKPQREELSEKKEWELAHQPIFLIGMILFFGAEWYLRRRWQLL